VLSTFDLDRAAAILGIAHDYFHLRNVAMWLLDKHRRSVTSARRLAGRRPGQASLSLGQESRSCDAQEMPVYAPDVSQERLFLFRKIYAVELAVPLMVNDSGGRALIARAIRGPLDSDHRSADAVLHPASKPAECAAYSLEQQRRVNCRRSNAMHSNQRLDLEYC